MSYLKKRLAKRLKDPTFREEWEDSELEYIIAENVIKLRKEKNLSQAELANVLNTTQSVISRIENANQNLSLTTLKGIASVFEVRVVDIMQQPPDKELEHSTE